MMTGKTVSQIRQGLRELKQNAVDAFTALREREVAAVAIPALSRDEELRQMLSRRIAFAQQSSVAYHNLPHDISKSRELV